MIRKGSFQEKQQRGLDWFHEELKRCVPFLGDRANELRQWDDLKLLSVRVDFLREWYRDSNMQNQMHGIFRPILH